MRPTFLRGMLMSDEKNNPDVSHVRFPEVRSFRTRKLEEIDRAFEEIEKRRAEMPEMPRGEEDEDRSHASSCASRKEDKENSEL
jgi:hypothetical protein